MRLIAALVLAICLFSCTSHSEHWETLAQVESYIEDRPDSALSVLERIDASELSGREEMARYALLYSMALDKNYIDTTTFDVLQPAIDYYIEHGTPDEQLRTYYYQGRIYQNYGNDSLAMECFVNAIAYGAKSQDVLTKARVYFAQSKIYYSICEWDRFIGCNKKAASLFKEAGHQNSYYNCIIRLINGYTMNNDSVNALLYIEECKPILSTMSINRMIDFYSSYLTYLVKNGTESDILSTIEEYTAAIPESKVDWLSVSNAYLKIKDYDNALKSLSRYSSPNTANGVKYQILLSEIYEQLGRYKEALSAYKSFMAVTDSVEYSIMRQNTKFVESRFQLEMDTIKERETKMCIILLDLIIVILLIAAIIWLRTKIKLHRIAKELAERKADRLQMMYQEIVEERDNLSTLLLQGNTVSPAARTAINKRIGIINKFITSYLTDKSGLDNTAIESIEELLSNKEAFMDSTKLAFEGSHPKFINYLEEKGLTDWEIKYCCLYALGLRGKDVGLFLKMRSHYNYSSDIREKLGINEHETNLGIYIRKLLSSLC